jgi:hypothetical protein
VRLCGEIFAGLVFDALSISFELRGVFIIILFARLCLLLASLGHFHVCGFLLALSLQDLDLSTSFWTRYSGWVVWEVSEVATLDRIELGAFSWGVVRVDWCRTLILGRNIEFYAFCV